jgi:uncharacterized delta-60 repeat protein
MLHFNWRRCVQRLFPSQHWSNGTKTLTSRVCAAKWSWPGQRVSFRPRLEALEHRSLLNAGALDTSFGSGGEVLTSIPGAANAYGDAVVAQPDGKIVVGGYISDSGGSDASLQFALVRYNSDGTLDMSFGNKGVAETKIGKSGSEINGLTLQSDGKIVAVGYAAYATTPNFDETFAVARYNPNGTLDTTFGAGKTGIVLTNIVTATDISSGFEQAYKVAIQGDGKIVVFGDAVKENSQSYFALVRYTTTGGLDASFGNGGIVTTLTPVGAARNALAIQSDGKILVGGGPVVARYGTTGMLDAAFNGTGIVTLAPPSPYTTFFVNGVLVEGDGTIGLGGGSSNGIVGQRRVSGVTWVRLTPGGALDNSFGNTGFVINTIMTGASAIAQGANGDLLAAQPVLNASHTLSDLGVAAFLPSGALDTTFGTSVPPNGISIIRFSGGVFGPNPAIALQGDGKIVAAGQALNSGVSNFALASFLGAASPTHLAITGPSSASLTAGSTVALTLTAEDSGGAPMPTYTGTVQLKSTDGQATADGNGLPSTYTFVPSDNGSHIFTVVLGTAGNQTITVTDQANNTLTATTSPITVTAGPFNQFMVSPVSNTITAGSPLLITAQAADAFGNPLASYSGPTSLAVSASPPDPQSNFPITGTLNSSGFGFFLADLNTAGSYLLPAAAGSFSGTSGSITVTPADASYFTVSVPTAATTGSPFDVTVTAFDHFGNVATGYTGTVKLMSTDPAVNLGSYTFTTGAGKNNGSHTFSVTLKTARSPPPIRLPPTLLSPAPAAPLPPVASWSPVSRRRQPASRPTSVSRSPSPMSTSTVARRPARCRMLPWWAKAAVRSTAPSWSIHRGPAPPSRRRRSSCPPSSSPRCCRMIPGPSP